MVIKISEVLCKSIITKSRLPESKYCINPYIGCQHGCKYCYARFMRRFTNHNEEWGKFVDVKINAPDILTKQIASSRKGYSGTVLLGSVTDAYQPIELKYKITRRMLQILVDHQLRISILTKSKNVTRDVDLLSRFRSCDIGISISSLKERFRKRFEPLASPVEKRIEALRTMKNYGISTYVFIGPIFPGFSDVSHIVESVRDYADYIMAESLNFRCGNWEDIRAILAAYYPEKIVTFRKAIENRQTWAKFEELVTEQCKTYGITFTGFFVHR